MTKFPPHASSQAQVQELWKKREELDMKTFRSMISSVAIPYAVYPDKPDSYHSPESKELGLCLFSGLPADTVMVGGYGSDWLDPQMLEIHNSIIDDLLSLARRVGFNTESLMLTDSVRSEYRSIFSDGSYMPGEFNAGFKNRLAL